MLHSSSSHYYACYYALLCLLYHQQQALAVTIVIDGATTNEWATKDEYQRLVDSSQGPLVAGNGGALIAEARQQPHQHPTKHQGHQPHHAAVTKLQHGPNGNDDEQTASEMLRSIGHGSGGTVAAKSADTLRITVPSIRPPGDDQFGDDEIHILTGGTARRLLQEGSLAKPADDGGQQEIVSSNSLLADGSNNQGNSFRNSASSQAAVAAALLSPASILNDRGELQLALDRLDLIERERKLQLKQLKQLDSLERAAETGVAVALNHANPWIGAGDSGASADNTSVGGARTLSELVPSTDSDLEDGSATRGGGATTRRETPRKYCGAQLIDILDMVCEQKFMSSDAPQINDPVVKTKRSVDYQSENGSDDELSLVDSEANTASGSSESGGAGPTMPVASHRRRLRTLQTSAHYEGDGEPAPLLSSSSSLSSSSLSSSSSSPVHDGNIGNNNHNHNHNHHEKQQKQQPQPLQQQRYLSKSNYDNNDNINNNYNNNLSANRNRQSRRAKLRGIRGLVADCCVRACSTADLKQYCKP